MSGVEGKVAVVTGAASGIGAASARRFAERGCSVVLADLQEEPGKLLADEIGEKAIFVRTDVTQESDIERAVDAAVENFGALDVMINNAGIVGAVGSAGYEAIRRSAQDELAESEERDALRRQSRMRIGIVLSLVIMALGMGPGMFGLPDFPGRLWIVCGLGAVVQFYVGSEFHTGAWNAARHLSTNMDTLVSLGSSVAFFHSLTVLPPDLDRPPFPVSFSSPALVNPHVICL